MITYTHYLSNSIEELQFKLKSSNKPAFSQTQICGNVLKHSPELVSEGFSILRENNIDETIDNLKTFIVRGVCTCQKCGKKFLTKVFRPYCSRECCNTSELRQQHIKETNLERYGVENVYQSEKIKNKIKATNLQKCGYEFHLQDPKFIQYSQEVKKKKYGSHIPMYMKGVREKIQNTLLRKYNTVSLSAIHIAHKENLTKNFFMQHFIENDEFQYNKAKKYFNCERIFLNRKIHEFGLEKYMNFQKSNTEIELFNWIPCDNKLSNDRKIIYPVELDMILPDYKLAIEYDGVYWHSDEYKDKNYHLNKTLECNNKGIQLFHIFDTDDIDIWKSMINNKLKLNTKVYARKCLVKEISYNDAKSFCAQNHLQGSCPSKINLGLFYNEELLEVMTFGKPRYNKHYEYELLRLCTKKYYSVIGGASKLWKYFLTKYSPKSVLSYANRRFSNGSIYETLGFKFKHTTNPNYWYCKNCEMFSRLKFQKHKLKNILKKYDENLSERENMKINNYYRIFDCGNLVYEYIA